MVTVEYSADMGRINISGEMLMELTGKPIAEQLKYYVIETVRSVGGAAAHNGTELTPLDKCYAVKSVIVRNGIVVGVEFMGRYGRVFGFLDEVCNIEYSTYFDAKTSQTHSTDCTLRWKEQ